MVPGKGGVFRALPSDLEGTGGSAPPVVVTGLVPMGDSVLGWVPLEGTRGRPRSRPAGCVPVTNAKGRF